MAILYMQGVSSQRELILGAKTALASHSPSHTIQVMASHSDHRHEILQAADVRYLEPKTGQDKYHFLKALIAKYPLKLIHAGAQGSHLIAYKNEIEALGVRLVAGALTEQDFDTADNKSKFTQLMLNNDLDVVPAVTILDIGTLKAALNSPPFSALTSGLCIKPVYGIYGLGFWRFKEDAAMNQHILNPALNIINPAAYVQAMAQVDNFKPHLLMPFYNGAETSVDMVVDKGNVIFAIARTKESKYQSISLEGKPIVLAKRCAQLLNADGLINVQTINDAEGNPKLLEANLRPSGGVCFSKACGINIAEVFFDYFYLGLTQEAIKAKYTANFREVFVKVDSHAIAFGPDAIDTLRTTV